MNIDVNHILDDGTVAPDTNAGTNVIKLPNALGVGVGQDIYVEALLTAAFNNRTTLTVTLQDSADGSTFAELLSKTFTLANSDLAAANVGKKVLQVQVPPNARQYLRMNYAGAGGTANTTGRLFVHIPVQTSLST